MIRSHERRIALVTGASSGVGADVARLLAGAGAKVALTARRREALAALAAEIEAAGGEALAVAADVTDEGSLAAAFDAAEARFGMVDTVVANAGMNIEGPAAALTAEQFDRIHAVNSRGVFLTAREAGRRLLAQGSQAARGRILIVASMGGLHPLRGLVAYCGSKASAVMLGRALALEWARAGICVNVLCPGYMLTGINDEWFESDAGRRMISQLTRGRLMPIEALRPTVLHLTSDAAAHVTGTVIQIDDGQHI
jgi:NAD(P)-dependent dehydrogenase (short-subunit alcohol dehydrogenase family)